MNISSILLLTLGYNFFPINGKERKGWAMTYLKEFQAQINSRNFSKFLQLWEEYCTSDEVDPEEFIALLKSVKISDFATSFGKLIETALPLWMTISDKEASYKVLRLLIDLQNTNSPQLAEITLDALTKKYGSQPQFNERLRLVGLRTKENFQGAITNYDLLSHMDKGKFVFHPGGWGTGEIIDISHVRQQVTIEFENVPGRKSLTFDNAFKALIPLNDDHFLVRRFAHPDALEKEAREDPVAIIKLLLSDLGPKSAPEIKDELVELVIPDKDWVKWWQGARAKLKKDPYIESPETLKDPFYLRKSEISQQDRLHAAIEDKVSVDEIISTVYDFLRDLSDTRKHQEVRDSLKQKLLAQLDNPELTPEQELQICMCLENHFNHVVEGRETKKLIQNLENVERAVNLIDIIALKKRALTLVKEWRSDWTPIFLNLMDSIKHSALRDYIIKELNQGSSKPKLEAFLAKLVKHPEKHPDFLVWYFQKIISKDQEDLPYGDKEGQGQFFEAYLVLLSIIESQSEFKDLTKKMYTLLSAKRYALVRAIMDGSDLEYVKEFLLLTSKCHTFTDHDRKILRSLAAVVHPSLDKTERKHAEKYANVIWTTEEAFLAIQDRVRHIGTVEVVENSREVEAARALGDLRENSEYKFAVERRSRLQGQLKMLSEQIKHARIITKDDINENEVSIGSVAEVTDSNGNKVTYTILGPWDANADENILSFQSKLAQAMLGYKKGESFEFRGEQFKITSLKSFLDKK